MTDATTDKPRDSGPAIATTTAGLRGAYWQVGTLPDGVQLTVHPLRTADKAVATGYLFSRGGERTVVCAMHPRELVVAQYMVPAVLEAGCAMWIMGPRAVGNDIRLEHEAALLDMAAGQNFLAERGYEQRVLLGNSGGGPLAAFYIQQATRAPEARVERTPGGRPTGLAEAALAVPSGLILVSSHLGQGPLLMNCIDPSVIDENDPTQTDASLDPFDAANGFVLPPHSSSYGAEFLARYRAAQRQRVERLDGVARAILKKRAAARKSVKESWSKQAAIDAAYSPVMTVWRTDADPRCFDMSLEPSERAYGTLWGANPFVSNYGTVGFARLCSAESWLSNWSALSSNATMEKCAPDLRVPTLMLEYTGDNSVFPSEADRLYGLIGSSDKTRGRILGNHQGQAMRKGEANGQIETGRQITAWLAAHDYA